MNNIDEKILQDQPREKRRQILVDTADHVEKSFPYLRLFSSDELIEVKDELSEVSIELSQIQDEYAELKAEFTDKMKPLKDSLKVTLTNIKQRGEFIRGEAFILLDPESRVAAYYNSEGTLIHQRPMKPSEFQKTIQMEARKTGTNE